MTHDILYNIVFHRGLVAECAEFTPDTAPHCDGRDALLRHEPHLRATVSRQLCATFVKKTQSRTRRLCDARVADSAVFPAHRPLTRGLNLLPNWREIM